MLDVSRFKPPKTPPNHPPKNLSSRSAPLITFRKDGGRSARTVVRSTEDFRSKANLGYAFARSRVGQRVHVFGWRLR